MSQDPIEPFHRRILEAPSTLELFADDAIIMPPNDTTLFGKEEIKAWWEEYYEYFRIASTVEIDRDITYAGDQAFERTTFSATIIPKSRGPRIQDEIRMLMVWRRGPDGAWKISHQMWNSIKPVGSGTNRYMTRVLQKKPRQRPAS